MSKTYIGPHLAAELRSSGRWDPTTMTVDKAETVSIADSTSSPTAAVPRDTSAPMKPPVTSNILVGLRPTEERTVPILESALRYVEQGISVLVADPATKKAQSSAVCDTVNVRTMFSVRSPGIAAQLGLPSRGLVVFDSERPSVTLAAGSLLNTMSAFGPEGLPHDHRVAFCPEAAKGGGDCRTVSFLLPMSMLSDPRLPKEHPLCVAEILANGDQCLLPPSGGRAWAGDLADLPTISWEELRLCAGLSAFIGTLIDFYPHGLAGGSGGVGGLIFLALTRILLEVYRRFPRYRENEQTLIEVVDQEVRAIAHHLGVKEANRIRHAAQTLARIKSGARCAGMATLVKSMGLPAECADAFREWLSLGDIDERPKIFLQEENLSKMLDAWQTAMLEGGVPIFQRSGNIVYPCRLERDHAEAGVRREAGSLLIDQANAHVVQVWMTDSSRLLKYNAKSKKWVPCAPPLDYCRSFLSMKPMWRVPLLRGISDAPIMRADGTICQMEGYDPVSQTLLDFGGRSYEPISEQPTKQDALAAIEVIDNVLRGFPFDGCATGTVKCASRSVALSLLLSGLHPVPKTPS